MGLATIRGELKGADGVAITSPFTVSLTDYGVSPPQILYVPRKIEVTPDELGYFEVDLWTNQESAHPCYYRVELSQGSSFLISVPGDLADPDEPLEMANLVVTKADMREDTNILNRIAKLEAGGGGGPGGSISTLTLGDGLTGVSFNGSSPVTVAVSSAIARVNSPTFVDPRSNHPPAQDSTTRLATTSWASDASNLTAGVLPLGRLPSNLAATTAQRLASPRSILGVSFDGTGDVPALTVGSGLLNPTPTTINVDFTVVASNSDPRFTNSREWTASTATLAEVQSGTDTTRRAFTVQRVWQAIAAWWTTVEGTVAKLASPVFTGTPSAPTPTTGDSSTRLATTAFSSNAANLTSGTIPSGRLPSSYSGNASSATKLETPRLILGKPFDGTADLDVAVGSGLTLGVSGGVLSLDDTDTRLTNAREWTASTVTQVEAEAGTATDRRAWTAQRVRQAITAWWSGVSGTLAPLASPALTGTPTAPTPTAGDSSTRLATTAFASNASNLASGTIAASLIPTLNQNTTGNATTATRLATPRTIMGVAFDGTINIAPTLTAGLTYPVVGSLGVDFTVVAALASPTFTGTPLAPTPTAGDSSTKIATTAFASNASNLTLGTIPSARLSSTVATTDTAQSFTALKTFTGGLSVRGSVSLTSFSGTTQAAIFSLSNFMYFALSSSAAPANLKLFDIELTSTGVVSFRRLNDAYSAVVANLLSFDTSNNATFSGYTTLGGNVGVACRQVTATTSSTANGSISVAHGVTGSKIVSITGEIDIGGGGYVPLNSLQPNYSTYISHDATHIGVTNNNGAGILSKPLKIFIWYTA